MGNPYWIYELDELHTIFDTEGRYGKWYDLRRYVLEPALKEINDYGTVTVKMTPQKRGRSVVAVRFDWRWKTIDEARETEEENERPASARHQDKTRQDAPPLIPEEPREREPHTEEQKQRASKLAAEARRLLRQGSAKK